ncbi:DUF6712 family protein [Elizabethkingia anophelis]|uniref:DUF6712 family protein n=1 Tax=Elizabethkingia anophelis TaxID=1117645 RepID=UPI0024E2583E|nr:DUF6712 family protein [Elizabethkingia anophelis]MCT4162119.1 hypothetical protein [Elizabethkingia anophelis]CAH1144080.1 hypothetical protein EAVNVB490_01625 [Elizabethkingia anophelis]CAI9670548.1 hypothetical protein EAVNNN508_01624 [Elizabethkingia anophelis]CAI9673176.1 hypothetical protein EAVNVB490_00538 [Elizabethkingia anophelis]CAI9678042.1 hypothetical protein EAVNNN508_00536 [Elizabethkingia anophelis]
MRHVLTIEDFKKYVGLPKTFGLDIIAPHQETAFRKKIFPYISSEMLLGLKESTDDSKKQIAELVYKAAACYSVIIAIPFIKVKINSFGIDQYDQEKMKTAPWWDVRDLGLSLVKIADEALSDALSAIGKNPDLKIDCEFFKTVSYPPIPTPEEFNKIYTINKSIDVYNLLVPLMKRVWQFGILEKIKICTVEDIEKNELLASLLKDALAYYALGYALKLSQFTFITSGVVIQYEELPWQKSLLLSSLDKIKLEEEFLKLANESLSSILKYLKEHPDDFPCYKPESIIPVREIIEKKSGIYL